MDNNNENSVGPTVGLIIILALIILGGLYFWGERSKPVPADTTQPTASSIEEQSSSDDVDSIQADLESTDTDGLDAELQAS